MKHVASRKLLRVSAGALALALTVSATTAHAQEPEKLFRNQCMGCHVAPNLEFEVEQAWLDQVKRTA